MAIIVQKLLFVWRDVEELGDLKCLYMVLNYLPDETLMIVIEEERGLGTDDYPV